MPKNEPIPTKLRMLLTTAINLLELGKGFWHLQHGAWALKLSLNSTVGKQAERFNFQIIYQGNVLHPYVKTETVKNCDHNVNTLFIGGRLFFSFTTILLYLAR